jgi:hypothetical protein
VIRLVPASLLACALLPAPASAAGFGALPVLPVHPAGRCLRATGAPGELVRWRADGAELIQATPSGFGAATGVPLGDMLDCPSAATRASGAGVIAAPLNLQGIGVALRDPGGSWMPATRIALAPIHEVGDLATAVSDRGDALVAWSESQELANDVGARVLVARRTPGAPLGAPEVLGPLRAYRGHEPSVRAGLQADGTAIVLWTQDDPHDHAAKLAFAAIAPPDQPFGPPQRLSEFVGSTPALAVAPDGRALAVLPEFGRTLVLERPPGGAFAPVAKLAHLLDAQVTVALRPDGAAVVAWADFDTARVGAVRRDRPGPFGPPEPLGPEPEDPFGPDLSVSVPGAPDDRAGRDIRAAFTADGRPLVTWGGSRTLGPLAWEAAQVAALPGPVQVLSGPLRDADAIAPVILPDGTTAVAWSDVARGGDALLHLALEGAAPAAAGPAPRVDIGRIRQVPHGLAVPFSCSAACDVRASVPGGTAAGASRTAAGSGRLTLDAQYKPIMLQRRDAVPVGVLSGPPGAHTAGARTITARLRVPRLPRVRALAAIRHGRTVVVSWRTERPAFGVEFIVDAFTRGEDAAGDIVFGYGRRKFRMFIDDAPGADSVRMSVVTARDAMQRRLAAARVR